MITKQGEAYIKSNLGYFVTVEGIDGSGTTTVAEALADHFDNTLLTCEPTEEWTGQHVRQCIADESTHPLTDFFSFMGDRVHHVEKTVRPAVEEGKLVISDRYADSTRAYQGVALQEETGRNQDGYINKVMRAFRYPPHLTLWLDVDPKTSFDRVDGDEKFEQELEFQQRANQRYRYLWNENERIKRIDANRPKEDVIFTCVNAVQSYYNIHLMEEGGEIKSDWY